MPTAPAATPITFPHTFHADPAYRYGSVLFSIVGVIGMGLAASHHDYKSMLVLAFPFLVFFGAILLTNLFELTVDETGLHQRSLLGRKDASWDQVLRLDFARTYAIYGVSDRVVDEKRMGPVYLALYRMLYGVNDRTVDENGRHQVELVWLSMLSIVNQQAIADEAILRASLQPSGAKLEFPLRKQWVR